MREMTTMDLEKDLIEIEHAIKSQIERDNMFTASVLQRCEKLVCELRKYKDLEEQGKLLSLPVVLGETIYKIDTNNRIVQELKVDSISIGVYAGKNEWRLGIECFLAYMDELWENYFPTREAAEAKLREMGSEADE